MRIRIDATEVGIAGGECGGVCRHILHLVRHVATAFPDSELEAAHMFTWKRAMQQEREVILVLATRAGCPRHR